MALLYKQNSAWGLPSLSPADVQVEVCGDAMRQAGKVALVRLADR